MTIFLTFNQFDYTANKNKHLGRYKERHFNDNVLIFKRPCFSKQYFILQFSSFYNFFLQKKELLIVSLKTSPRHAFYFRLGSITKQKADWLLLIAWLWDSLTKLLNRKTNRQILSFTLNYIFVCLNGQIKLTFSNKFAVN